ncbi:S8 family serine peptidase [Solwaraspora sp. WMMB335]|uniref:S8 family serine peptidase n=1 Tax=Solwaraspora sp. WMMB335 TaxID=3404118 RepID=UPI003B92F1B6
MRASRQMTAVSAVIAAGFCWSLVLSAGPAQADEVRDRSWHVPALRLDEVHRIGQGDGITVAVVDTGVDASHPDLRGNVLPGADLFDSDSNGHIDRRAHGTGMASLIAGHGHGEGNRAGVLGVAPKAKILPVSVASPRSEIIRPETIALAIDWAVDNGADIVNVSLTGSSHYTLEDAVKRAYQRGVVVVASVGNRSEILIGQPARSEWTIAVTGSDRDNGVSPQALQAEETHLAAPGVELVQAAPGAGYQMATGASGATALVSGAMALIMERYPDADQSELFQRLVGTSVDAGEPGKDLDYGWGVLDVHAALTEQPDDRASPRPTASQPADGFAQPPLGPGREDDFGTDELVGMVLFFAILGALVTGVVLLIRTLRRRSSRSRPVTVGRFGSADGPVGPGRPGGLSRSATPPVPPAAAGGADDSIWRPPDR